MTLSPIYPAAKGKVDPEKGVSMRFPRFIRERSDKTVLNSTTVEEIVEMYKMINPKNAEEEDISEKQQESH